MQGCKYNTSGLKCDQCAAGFYLDHGRLGPDICQPCECPSLMSQKTNSCVSLTAGNFEAIEKPFACLDCEDKYVQNLYMYCYLDGISSQSFLAPEVNSARTAPRCSTATRCWVNPVDAVIAVPQRQAVTASPENANADTTRPGPSVTSANPVVTVIR